MYATSIIWILSWPILIIVSYQVIKLVVRIYEKKIEKGKTES